MIKTLFTNTISLAVCCLALPSEKILSDPEIKNIITQHKHEDGLVANPKKLLFCWSKLDHPKHCHSYERFATSWAHRVSKIDNISAKAPTKEQWEVADLVSRFN